MKTKVFVAGHNGMVGSAICRNLKDQKETRVITASKKDLDLTNQKQVKEFFSSNSFDEVYIAAAKVGGIFANNNFPADFIYQNLMIQTNIINECFNNKVSKLLFLGSSCIYPRLAEQPMKEASLLSGYLEPTNEPYAIAKIAGIKLCESYNRQFGTDYRCIMPTNLYGPGDNYHSENSHVIPALIRRFYEASLAGEEEVKVWGTGSVFREFLYVDDMASASIHLMNLDYDELISKTSPMLSHINIGSGREHTIKEVAETIAKVTQFKGKIVWDISKPDGPPRKLLDSSLIKSLGWQPSYDLKTGLKKTFLAYKNSINDNNF